jgi:hypothetical protein
MACDTDDFSSRIPSPFFSTFFISLMMRNSFHLPFSRLNVLMYSTRSPSGSKAELLRNAAWPWSFELRSRICVSNMIRAAAHGTRTSRSWHSTPVQWISFCSKLKALPAETCPGQASHQHSSS